MNFWTNALDFKQISTGVGHVTCSHDNCAVESIRLSAVSMRAPPAGCQPRMNRRRSSCSELWSWTLVGLGGGEGRGGGMVQDMD